MATAASEAPAQRSAGVGLSETRHRRRFVGEWTAIQKPERELTRYPRARIGDEAQHAVGSGLIVRSRTDAASKNGFAVADPGGRFRTGALRSQAGETASSLRSSQDAARRPLPEADAVVVGAGHRRKPDFCVCQQADPAETTRPGGGFDLESQGCVSRAAPGDNRGAHRTMCRR